MTGFGTFEADAAGRLCYLPPVPPFPGLDDVWPQLQRASDAVSAFDRALAAFAVPGVVGSLFARLDAVHNSGAEGTTTTFTDLMEYATARRQAADPEDARAVAACGEAFDDLAGGASADPLTAARAIHRRLFDRHPDPMIAGGAGRWKVHPNGVFDPDLGGNFHYTAPGSVADALDRWTTFTLTAEDERPALVRQALSHWMFEHIHPFADGNGRVGRLLVPLALRWQGLTAHACAFLGEAAHRDKETYVEALKDGRRTGDLGAWTRVFLSMVARTAQANLARLDRLAAIHARWRAASTGPRAHGVIHRLVPFALTRPVFAVRDAQTACGASFQAVNVAVGRLVDLGILCPLDAQARERLFAAPEVLEVFEDRD